MKRNKNDLIKHKQIESMIFSLRGEKVILDSDLAFIFGVTTARLNQQVNRNKKRFPDDFVIPITKAEFKNLMLQNATSSGNWGGRRKIPFAFTEHGVIMAANVLNSNQAVQMSVLVVRVFVQIRKTIIAHIELSKRLDELEHKVLTHDNNISELIEVMRELMQPPTPTKPAIGFAIKEPKIRYTFKKSEPSKLPQKISSKSKV